MDVLGVASSESSHTPPATASEPIDIDELAVGSPGRWTTGEPCRWALSTPDVAWIVDVAVDRCFNKANT
jgi:hypothetical protein